MAHEASPIRAGVLVWNQYTSWPALRQAGARIDALGYESLWTWDHLYPIIGDPRGPFLEGYMLLAAWSQRTTRATLGLMVGANTFRNPALVVKMVTTLDHLSDGRAVLGIGAAWFDTEHEAFGIEFGRSVGERLDWLDEAAELMRGMLDAPSATARGVRYHARDVRNDPPPVRQPLPILIGGAGERKTLRTVARFADAWNVALVTPEEAAHKDEVLRRWCDEVGRDPATIERTISLGPLVIRDDPADARAVIARFHEANPGMQRSVVTGSVAEVAEHCRAYVARGFRHLIFHLVAPYDDETMERFASEVRPLLVD
jgi:alkanesulfonate monooxygenase SsuD/methylene tetrahydromethanopterin reductase-like flavin-dependent oxidoreductase (luciferase family)